MKNPPVPEGYAVEANAHFTTCHDTSELPMRLIAALNECASNRHPDNARSDMLAAEVADELLAGSSMYLTHDIPGLSDGSYAAANQIVHHAWNRTFTERLEEVARRYKDVSPDELQRDLTVAWWNIEQIITRHGITS